MLPVSSDFKREIINGASLVTVGDIYRGEELLLPDVPISGGSITSDPDALVRRRCTLNIDVDEAPDLYVPSAQYRYDQGLWPAGNQINVRQGVKYRDGRLGTEWVNLGWFILTTPRVHDSGDQLTLSVSGSDISRRLHRCKLRDEYTIQAGTFVPYALKRTLMDCMPTLTDDDFDIDDAIEITALDGGVYSVTPHLVLARGDSPWEKMSKLCRWQGMDLDITTDRKIRLRRLPNPVFEDPYAVYEEGEYNIFTEVERVLDDENAINGVVIIGENSSNPVVARGEAWDLNPFSPTYYDPNNPAASVYGPNPKIVSVNWVADDSTARLVAALEFNKYVGVIETVSITALPMFCHEPYDIVRLKRARAGIDGEYMFASMEIGLGPEGALHASTRQRELIHWSGSEL